MMQKQILSMTERQNYPLIHHINQLLLLNLHNQKKEKTEMVYFLVNPTLAFLNDGISQSI